MIPGVSLATRRQEGVEPVPSQAMLTVVAAALAALVIAAGAAGCGGSTVGAPSPPPPATAPAAQETVAGAAGNAVAIGPVAPAQASGASSAPDAVADVTPELMRESDAAPAPATRPAGILASSSGQDVPVRATSQASTQGREYTWQDGDSTRHVWIQVDLVAQPTTRNRPDDVIAAEGGVWSIVRKQARHEQGGGETVFRSEAGELLTFPGGALVMLDEAWDAARVGRFFADQGIAMSRAEALSLGPNVFLVSTAPGIAAIELANALAGLEGVVYAVPNRLLGMELQ